MKVGDEYFACWVDSHEGVIGVDHWIITVIRSGRAHACRKNKWTWVKRSPTSGDYGWAKNLDKYDRAEFPEGEPPADWARTKAAAYTKALPEVEAAIKRLTKLRAQMTGQRTKARAKSQKPLSISAHDTSEASSCPGIQNEKGSGQ